MRVRSLLLLAAALALGGVLPAVRAIAAAAETYRTPPKVVADILTAPRIPRGIPNVSPDGARIVLPELPSLIPIATLAEPVDKLAGLEVLPTLRCTRDQLKRAIAGFSVARIADGRKVRAQLAQGARVGPVTWSTRGDRLACALYAPGGAELWVVDAATGAARRIEGVRLNTVLNADLEWTLDDRAIVCAAVPASAAGAAEAGRVPAGPQVRIGAGKATPQRTARDVLRSADDQQRFVATTTAQLVRVPVGLDGDRGRDPSSAGAATGASPGPGGALVPLGEPGMIESWSLAPDERHLALQRISATPPGFPFYLFPGTVEIRGADGARIATVGDLPLNDRSAISSVAPLGPRGWTWAPDGRALWFFSWQDTPGADFFQAVKDTSLPQPGTDRLMRLDAPFTGAAAEVATSDFQLERMTWTADGKKLLLADGYQPRRRARWWWLAPGEGAAARHPLVSRSVEGVYDDPGRPLMKPIAHGEALWTTSDGRAVWLAGEGFRPDGQRPFLDRMDLATGKTTRIYESAGDVLEPALVLLAADGKRFVTSRQTNKVPPNYHLREAGGKPGRRLSDYADPAPALTASQRTQFKFMRPDSVWLNAEVVLPADWKPGTRLPTIFWVYPGDYRSAAAASQNRRSPNRFPSQSTLNPEVLVTRGYAVMYPDIAVVGTNDRYVEEIRLSAEAALDEAVRRGFCDPQRVGVGGHSYGAFSAANLLAHTTLFRAGTASDGAYNRTLTPFTFQAEERTLWEARDTYLGMSPFLHADRIQSPLLLIHDLDDTNVGTNPIQSERMYEALNGMGKTVALVQYPFEDHVPVARESVLDYWARVIEWFDRYVKSAPAPAQVSSPMGGDRP
ncbi:MAG: S9 family peptidase [Candidatus Eisenbacteria bacterium]|nr:S9 family peptidase [Candidatus Eisenbacteria bacterium]